MLFLGTITFKGENKAEFFKRALELMEQGKWPPPGIKVINQWSSLKGKKVTALMEVENPGALMEASDSMDDLADMDYEPVMPTADAMKLDYFVKKY